MSAFSTPYVAGMTVALPKERVHLRDLPFREAFLERTIKLTGIEDVCYAPSDKTVTDYAVAAAKHLFQTLEFDPSKIDGILFVSGYPDYIQPCTAGVIQARLNLTTKCVAMDINHVCSGFVYGLMEAFMLIQNGLCHNVLLCMGDLAASRAIHPKDRSGRMVAGDSGAAVLISAFDTPRFSTEFSFYHDGTRAEKLGIFVGANRRPRKAGVTDVEKEDENGNVRTDESFYMDGMEVMRFAMTEVRPSVQEVLDRCGWTKEDVDVFGFHQANEFIVKNLMRNLKLPAEKTPIFVRHTGNLGPDSIPMALIQHSLTHDTTQWKRCVLCGFGAGLSCASVGIDFSETHVFSSIEV